MVPAHYHDVDGDFSYHNVGKIFGLPKIVILPPHFDDVSDDILRLMKPNLVKIQQELPKSPTRNIITNYKKYRTLHECNTNLRSIA